MSIRMNEPYYQTPASMYGNSLPLSNAQQRLALYDNQMPHFNGQQTQGMYTNPSAPVLKGRSVTGIEEVRGSMIDHDGSLFIFPNLGQNRIYTKQIDMNGNALIQSFALEQQPAPVVNNGTIDESKFVTVEQLNSIVGELASKVEAVNQDITTLKNQTIEEVKGGTVDVSSKF